MSDVEQNAASSDVSQDAISGDVDQMTCRPYGHCTLQTSLRTTKTVRGIAQLGELVYVVCFGSDTIQIYRSRFEQSLEQVEGIPLPGLKDPTDIAVCKDSRRIYVADWVNECVWRVTSPADEQHDVREFISYVEPRSLSVTSRRLLMTSFYENTFGAPRLAEKLRLFGPDGKQLKQVSLPGYMEVQYAVETGDETFLVSHVEFRDGMNSRKHKVSEVGADGHVIRVCDAQLNDPQYLALDDVGRVFVADRKNHRILLLNKQLQLERVLLDKERDQLDQPRRLHYLPETGRLLVLVGEDCYVVNVYGLR